MKNKMLVYSHLKEVHIIDNKVALVEEFKHGEDNSVLFCKFVNFDSDKQKIKE